SGAPRVHLAHRVSGEGVQLARQGVRDADPAAEHDVRDRRARVPPRSEVRRPLAAGFHARFLRLQARHALTGNAMTLPFLLRSSRMRQTASWSIGSPRWM